jgi:cytochrome b
MAAPGTVPRMAVWDLPVRLFHWMLAVLVVFSWITGKVGGDWLAWHMRSGYAILALLAFRLAWGVVGSDTARFASFLRGPAAGLAYAREVLARRHPHVLGHNPLGGWMIVFMLAMLVLQASSGLFADDEIATRGPLAVKASEDFVSRMSRIHYYDGWLLAGLVVLHLVAIAAYQWVLRVNLVGPMVHGSMAMEAGTAPPRMRSMALAALLFAVACAAVWWLVVIFPKTG